MIFPRFAVWLGLWATMDARSIQPVSPGTWPRATLPPIRWATNAPPAPPSTCAHFIQTLDSFESTSRSAPLPPRGLTATPLLPRDDDHYVSSRRYEGPLVFQTPNPQRLHEGDPVALTVRIEGRPQTLHGTYVGLQRDLESGEDHVLVREAGPPPRLHVIPRAELILPGGGKPERFTPPIPGPPRQVGRTCKAHSLISTFAARKMAGAADASSAELQGPAGLSASQTRIEDLCRESAGSQIEWAANRLRQRGVPAVFTSDPDVLRAHLASGGGAIVDYIHAYNKTGLAESVHGRSEILHYEKGSVETHDRRDSSAVYPWRLAQAPINPATELALPLGHSIFISGAYRERQEKLNPFGGSALEESGPLNLILVDTNTADSVPTVLPWEQFLPDPTRYVASTPTGRQIPSMTFTLIDPTPAVRQQASLPSR
jgi:hypothetical protein